MQSALPSFRFEEIIGRGGMGAVYKATELSLHRAVAIKILPADLMEDAEAFYAERFAQEARTMARLNHPGLVRVFDFGKTADGLLYFVMEYVEGTDLARLLKESGKLTPERALDVAEQMCRALDYAHREGVVHRDIKPANLLLTRDGQVKIADFGLAKQHDAAALGFTKSSMAVGTPDYLAPEAWTPGTALDGRADLFAAGVVLYQMLTGQVPRGLWPLASDYAGTDVRFDAVIDKAVQPERDARYATAAEMIAELEAIRITPEEPVRKPRRKWWLPAGGAAAAAAITGLLLWPPNKKPARFSTHVTSTAETGPGSLREAMDNCDANPGPDTITFAPELAGQTFVIAERQPRVEPINLPPGDARLVPGGPIFIDAGSIPGGIVISSAYGSLFLRSDDVSMRGLTFTGSLMSGRHAVASFGRFTATDCVFDSNHADVSGAAFFNMLEGNAEFVRCRFTGNTAPGGAAIHNLGTLVLTDCTFTGNKASSGGAISQDGGTITMTNCTFTENEAAMRGGAIAAVQGTVTATRCTLQKNSVTGTTPGVHGGGGIFLTDPAVVNLDSCLVSENTAASGNGPEVWNQGGTLNVTGASALPTQLK